MNKLRRLAIAVIAPLLSLSSCQWNEYDAIELTNIVGNWVSYEINGEIVPTDSTFCLQINDYNTGLFAACMPDKNWNTYDRTYTFNSLTRELCFDGRYYNGQYCQTTFLVNECDGQTMTVTVKNLKYDGVARHDNRIITLKKLTELNPEEFVGLWEGYEFDNDDNGRRLGGNRRWEYFADGSYNYYHEQDDEGVWQLKSDNEGKYYLFCNFLSTVYMNDINESTVGRSCECWLITIYGDEMTWMAVRGGRTHRFVMRRVMLP